MKSQSKTLRTITLGTGALAMGLGLVGSFDLKAEDASGGGPSVSCATASQVCYEVFVSGVKIKTVDGKAQIRL